MNLERLLCAAVATCSDCQTLLVVVMMPVLKAIMMIVFCCWRQLLLARIFGATDRMRLRVIVCARLDRARPELRWTGEGAKRLDIRV